MDQGDKAGPSIVLTGTAQEKLAQLVSRIERLEEEKKSISDDIKETYAEAKGVGFDTKVLRQVVRERKQDREERETQRELRDLYSEAVERTIEKIRGAVASI